MLAYARPGRKGKQYKHSVEEQENGAGVEATSEEDESPSPLSFIPIELTTLIFVIYRIIFNILYFIQEEISYLWIGHLIEIVLCIAATYLHATRLYQHWDIIWRVSMAYKGYTLLFTLINLAWMVGAAMIYYTEFIYFQQWYLMVAILSLLPITSITAGYYTFIACYRKVYDDPSFEIEWFTWWIDIPLIILNLTVTTFLLIEMDVWVSVWIGDLFYHFSEIAYLCYNKRRKEQHRFISIPNTDS